MSSRYFDLYNRQPDATNLPVEGTPDSNGDGTAAAQVKDGVEAFPESALDSRRLKQPESARKQILQLVHRLFVTPRQCGPLRLVLISSIGHGDAEKVTAWTAEMLAAHAAGSVCLVDANTQSPGMHQLFATPDTVGFYDYVANVNGDAKNPRSFVFPIGDGNLWVMPAGGIKREQPAISAELLVSALAGLKSNFDYVLINAPISEKQALSTAMAPLSDGVVLVITAGSTRREVVMKAKTELEASDARVLGAVLHNRSLPIPQFLYKRLF